MIATMLPVATFLAGLKIIGATDASLLSTFEPVVTVVLAALLLGEKVQPMMVIGGVLILVAVLLIVKKKKTLVDPSVVNDSQNIVQ